MKNKKFVYLISSLIIIQPFFDVFIYFINNVLNLNISLISFIRPIIAISIFIYLLFLHKSNLKRRKIYFVYIVIFGLYSIFHLLNIKNYFFDSSYGTLSTETRYLFTYGYYLIQLVNFDLLFKILDNDGKNKILKSFVIAALIITTLYFTSVLTNTSPNTYLPNSIKLGWKGWSVSSHYIGHCLTYLYPIIIYTIFEKKIFYNKFRYFVMIFVTIPGVFLVGTKTPLFAQIIILVFYTIINVLKDIFKSKKFNKDTSFFVIFSIIIILTFRFTFGYNNFLNQKQIYSSNKDNGVEVFDKNESQINFINPHEDVSNISKCDTLCNRLDEVFSKNSDIKVSYFDNRDIQKVINRNLFAISPINDIFFGYGHDTLPNCNWVETDAWTIFYCYGLLGFILLIVIPIGNIFVCGLSCLFRFKEMTSKKLLLGLSFCLSVIIIFEVGYTMQFAQTVIYLVVLWVICKDEFLESKKIKEKRKYLFAINDLSVGGAEVGLIDVIEELSKKESVDLVLLRKQGPLLDKIKDNNNIRIYEIINSNYSTLKKKIYHIMYFLGGIFTKYVYSKTINCEYDIEIAYIEGYPAVFIANSTNNDSVKIASIRVGLKKHKLNAEKIPFGKFHLKNAYSKMDKIYTVSKETSNEFIEKFPKCKGKTSTIYTYFNVDSIKEKSLEKMDFEYDKNYINFLAVGRFQEQKGYLNLIEAFERVYKLHKNVRLHMIGKNDTDYGNNVISLIKNKNLENIIILHGIKSNPYPYIKNCDYLISSSFYEGYPRVINEALSLNKLCIGTDVTGTKEALLDGKRGILVECSVEGLIDGMTKVIENKNLYAKYKAEIENFDGNKKSFFESFGNLVKKKQNMIIYMPKLSYGGMEKSLVNLINYANLNDKYDLTLYLVYKGKENYIDMLPKNINLIIACNSEWNIIGKTIAMIKLLYRYFYHIFVKFDISISYSYQHGILCSLTRLSSNNNIVYIHSNLTQATTQKQLKRRLKKCKYEKFNKIICVSEDSRQALIKLINRNENIFTIRNFIDGDKIIKQSNEDINDFKFIDNKVYFINICRHDESCKKLTRIIEATKKLNEEGYKFEVLFIGDGKDDILYKKLIKQYDIKNIYLLGRKINPYKYLKNSNALLLSSIREGYPVVFVESMVLNKPIITTNVSDAMIDIKDKFGIVVENNDIDIYNGMKKFLDEGFEIKQKFDYRRFNNNIAKETENIYRD